jgi:uncharacterized protein involved in type VI secretion and phage assembly
MTLEAMLRAKQEATMADANHITASSRNPKLKIGKRIRIEAIELNIDTNEKQNQEVGTYIITEITHKVGLFGEYENSFKAIPAFVKKLPEPVVVFPQAQTQQAQVLDNNDPKGQGRIRVRMLWQKHGRTPWLRVLTPDAGTSSEVATNRGMVFIPEIGDQVMIGFRYNDPNRPFVLGSLFNGKTGKGGLEKNHLKSIATRGGSTLTFNEIDNSVLVKDPSGNSWFLDGKGNIEVTAPKNFIVNAGDISLIASQNITTSAGMNITETAGMNKNQTVGAIKTSLVTGDSFVTVNGKLMENITGNIESYTGNDRITKSQKGMSSSTEGEIEKHSQKETKINGTENSKQF